MELLSQCPICRATKFSNFLKCEDNTVSHETFQLDQCSNCKFVFTNPRPNASEIVRYYQSENYISHSNSSKGLLNLVYQKIRSRAIASKTKMITGLGTTKNSILDYGCGTGEFLNAMQTNGWICKGIEPSAQARQLAIKNYNLKISEPTTLDEFENGEFGVITLWHVLEHVHELYKTIKQLNTVLIKGGFLIIAVPNRQAWDAQYYKEHWAAYDVPRHLYHFTKENIIQLFTAAGLELISTKPLFFDPFYIALLSEKHKNGKNNYLKALITGIKTTIAGKKDITKNSSLIYIFQKKI